jgi:hypothetical protein
MTESEQHGGVMNRLEDSRAGFIVRYWEAAAYDNPESREPMEWAKAALVPLALVLPLALLNALALYIVDTYPGYFPEYDTTAGTLLSILPATYDLATALLFAVAVMYLGKLVILSANAAHEVST